MYSATSCYSKLASVLLKTGARQAVMYVTPGAVVQATRQSYDGKFSRRVLEIRFTAGAPNYLARRFIKACRRAGEPFPVRKIQLRFPVKRSR